MTLIAGCSSKPVLLVKAVFRLNMKVVILVNVVVLFVRLVTLPPALRKHRLVKAPGPI